jgi:hypothetical protein
MVVSPLVWSSNDHDRKVFFVKETEVVDGGLEPVGILGHPFLEVERRNHLFCSMFLALYPCAESLSLANWFQV